MGFLIALPNCWWPRFRAPPGCQLSLADRSLALPCPALPAHAPAPARCRFKSLQKRALIEPRRKIEQKKHAKKIEYVQVGALCFLCWLVNVGCRRCLLPAAAHAAAF